MIPKAKYKIGDLVKGQSATIENLYPGIGVVVDVGSTPSDICTYGVKFIANADDILWFYEFEICKVTK